ncbi:MAG: DUF1553 domain-containing protein [Fimbriimonadales bacterium]
MLIRSHFLAAVFALGLLGVGVASVQKPAAPAAPKVDFNRDIRPIIGKCFTCHGPSTGEGMAGLRLDKFETATKKLESGRQAIVPFKPDESELIERINAKDEGMLMPPPESHKTLNADEKRLLRDWIAQGAEYKIHWAFVAPVRHPLPPVQDAKWPKNGIDHFVLAKLEAAGLKPEPEASRATLLRRLSLDITGLPPTPAEVDAFVNDRSQTAYEKVVDRLLQSPRYGERMAMDWMDYARYADSNGYQADYERFQSRWRDWVIDAFNKNMPYDQFTVEQIAGDLLPNPTIEQRLATAFNRNHRINTEGGVIAEEWRVETVVDRVETTSAVWLGLTAGCARCHDHKYDPFTQKDFYRFFAFFNNVPESGTGEERPISHPPTMKAPSPAQQARLAELGNQISSIEKWQGAKAASRIKTAANWKVSKPLPFSEAGLVLRTHLSEATKAEGTVQFDAGRATGAVVTSDKGYVDLGNVGDFERDQAFSFGGWIKPNMLSGTPFSRMDSNSAYRGWEVSLNDGRVQAHIISNWPTNAMKIISKAMVPNREWTHVFVTYDGSSKVAGFKMFLNGKPVETTTEVDALSGSIRTGVSTKIGRRTNSEFFNGAVDDFTIYSRALQPVEIAGLASIHPAVALLAVPAAKRTPEQALQIARLWSLENDPEFAKADANLIAAKNEQDEINRAIPDVMVMEEMPKPRDAFILQRGQYDKHGEKVTAGLPAFLPPMPKDAPNNRLGLAEWIVSPENPLTARVTVNRLWERFFGTGLVSTSEDFGTRAEFPTNPELLDYLATELHRLKWDLKAMIKEIVMSAAYRQSSKITDEKLKHDPENRLISRGPRFRLPGEVIRDQALFVSGLLVEKLGGPSVRPVQPKGIWDETNFYGNLRDYQPSLGPDLYRRSLYTIWKRTAAPPNMLLFDVPSRETCRVRRARTDTPLQALTLMNDETYIEASRVLAQRIMKEGGSTPEARIAYGFRLVVGRAPSASETSTLSKSLAARIARYQRDPEGAEALVNVGYARVDKSLNQAELAAYTITASTLLNLDETVTKE